jgi:thiol-disulfide isomerase/thioredoxin
MMRQVLAMALIGGLLAVTVALGRYNQGRADHGDDETAAAARPGPELPEGAEWVQGGPLKLADLRGRVVVLHFWTNGCINCIHNYPVYRSWQEKYAGKDLTILGVHTPEFAWEAPAARVRSKARDNGLKFPIVLDPDNKIWRAWGNRYWPSIYLIDKSGQVRYRWEGELHLDTAAGKRFARRVDELLAEKPPPGSGP